MNVSREDDPLMALVEALARAAAREDHWIETQAPLLKEWHTRISTAGNDIAKAMVVVADIERRCGIHSVRHSATMCLSACEKANKHLATERHRVRALGTIRTLRCALEEFIPEECADESNAMSKKRDWSEDAADAAIYLARRAALGADGTLPPEVSAAILRGEKARGAIRKWRGLTQGALAERLGITKRELLDIESGQLDPSKDLTKKMARVLDVPVEWID